MCVEKQLGGGGGGGGGGGMCVQFQHVFILKFQLFFSSSLFYSYDKL